MVKEKIDAMGKQCPIPIVMAKQKIAEMKSGTVTVAVDNETAVENLKKLAVQSGYTCADRKVADRAYEVDLTFENAGASGPEEASDVMSCVPEENEVIVVSSDEMGTGDTDLGKILLKGFLYAVASQEELPKTILFYNRGAFVTTEGSDSLPDLKNLEEAGVEILTCGTCLQHYGLSEKLQVGSVTNMYTITEKLTKASKILRP